MSDYIVKIIPADAAYQITEKQAQSVLEFLKANIKSDKIESIIQDSPVFVDCGSNLERILCPHCKVQQDFEWWGKAMDNAAGSDFKDLSVIMPCCKKESSLNDLKYDFPCGFASFEFDIWNPDTEPDLRLGAALEKRIGSAIRIIHAHL